MSLNGVMMQYFEWDINADGSLWREVKEKAEELKEAGVTALWLPPAYKGYDGPNDSGYGVYDLYDLGEFEQKSQNGEVRTKYGTKEEYIEAIEACHKAGIKVYADVVFNHMTGAEKTERVNAIVWRRNSASENWYRTDERVTIDAWTDFLFEKRGGKYSTFKWNKDCFDGVDTNGMFPKEENKIYLFEGKEWDNDTNFDFLNCSDIDAQNPKVVEELKAWAKWYLETTNVDGFRLDALKHIEPAFYNTWLDYVGGLKELFVVGEYFDNDHRQLEAYLTHITTANVSMHLFDFSLHEKFYNASWQMDFYLPNLLKDTLVSTHPMNAVTFVDNHDTQIRKVQEAGINAREINDWFKPHAYAFILLREEGYPCVFYKDYTGSNTKKGSLAEKIQRMITVRRKVAYGRQTDYVNEKNELGWSRESEYGRSGVAVLLSKGDSEPINMYVGMREQGKCYVDVLGNQTEKVVIGEEGQGKFTVSQGGVSVWIEEEESHRLFG